jgi:O-antigen biosynthesis protein
MREPGRIPAITHRPMPFRRAGAPRLIDWTGERCVPWAPDVQVIYEHYHRYLWAQPLVSGHRVLDLGSGEGFGAALLADTARAVVGIDIDARTVEHSQLNYVADNLEFRTGSATDLGAFPNDAFDVVVAFEVIEHIRDQEGVLAEVKRVLDDDGLFVVSTPERRTYSEASGYVNPFHEHELTREELSALVSGRFSSLALFLQAAATGSRIQSLEHRARGPNLAVQIERVGDEWRIAGPPAPRYLIGVASDSPLPELPGDSTLSDFGLGLLREAEGAVAEERERAQLELHAAERRAREQRQHLVAEVTVRTRELDNERRLVRDVRQELAETRQEFIRVEHSVTWQLFQRARARLYGSVGHDSLAGRSIQAMLRLLGRLTGVGARRNASEGASHARSSMALSLPRFAEPEVSVVIPVPSGGACTERCLRALLHSSDGVPYEVVVVEDAADSETKALLDVVEGIRVVHGENLGFVRSANRGVAEARGRHVVLLKHDTEPQPGWLRAMVERAETTDDAGIVTAKLIGADGSLEEAGGIVWRNGEPWSYGKGRDPGAPEYNFVREVDYGSATALLMRSEVWRAAGGLDESLSAGTFEDADLCFTARALGWRVLYEPRAVVIHAGDAAAGVDGTRGGKRHQRLDQPKFAAKWRDALADQLPEPSQERARLASDRRRGPHVLVVDEAVPAADRDPRSLRMWRILEGLVTLGCRVTFVPDDREAVEPYAWRLRGIGIEVLDGQVDVAQRITSFDPWLRLAILSRPNVAARYVHLVREHAPGALVAYDAVDQHLVSKEHGLPQEDGTEKRVADGLRHLELAMARSSDITLVVTGEQRDELATAAPEVAVEVVPEAHEIAQQVPPPEDRSGLVFVGSFGDLPAVEAVVRLGREVMPRVWHEIEDVTLTVVGDNPPPEVSGLASPRIKITGQVEDLTRLLQESMAMVAPLRHWAGIKGAVAQSLAAGLPVVTSSTGAEEFDTVGREPKASDEPEVLAERIVRLHRDTDAWRESSAHGQAIAERVCSPATQRAALSRLLDASRARDAGSHVPATP